MRPRPMNLYGLLRKLPNNGVGLRVYRSYFRKYDEPSHYTIVKVTPPTETSKCRIFGVLTWRGTSLFLLALLSDLSRLAMLCCFDFHTSTEQCFFYSIKSNHVRFSHVFDCFNFRSGNTELKVARISRVAAREWHCVEFPDASTVVSSKEKKAAAAAAEAEKAAAPPAAAVAAESAKQAL
jgi:hypothetical protein